MKLQRHGLVVGLIAGALALSACGSDNEGDTPAAGGGTASGTAAECPSGSLSAAGSSAQNTAYTAWIAAYQAQCGDIDINYDPQGSGNGRTSFFNKQVPLAGSDSAIKDEDRSKADARCAPGKAVDLPTVITPIAAVYNLQGLSDLTLTPTVLAQIFDGKVTKWNDPAIAKANPGAELPDTSITAVHRATDSGTTENFTKFLSAQDPKAWTYEPGQAWPAKGGQGASNSAAMVQQVKGTDGAIGYVDNPDAVKNKLNTVAVDTGSGPVKISSESVAKAVEAAKPTGKDGDVTLKIDYGLKAAGAYPAILATYQITCTEGLTKEQAGLVKGFLTYQASDAGQSEIEKVGYVPLPSALKKTVQDAIAGLASSS
ncbi:MAG TPA: phosphate ABC transporter substrate-binding protein PstS [Mycobacteriales bacterium]